MIVPFSGIREITKAEKLRQKGEYKMNSLKKFFFASFLGLALSISGAANTQGSGQDKKPPEPVKERDKQDKKDDQKDRKNDDKKNDDRRGGDKKKP